eukprot:Platyproteum_vivax@DN4010_c0_g1_i1.p1
MSEVIENVILRALEEKEEAIDEEIRRMDNLGEDDLENIRQNRIREMKENAKKRGEFLSLGHGQYSELYDAKDFFESAKKSSRLVVHFWRPSTWRCEIIDKHLSLLAPKHMECRFVKVNAEKMPWLAEKMQIIVLPTLVLVKDGATEHSIIGLDEFGGKDDFATEVIEKRLADWGLLTPSD